MPLELYCFDKRPLIRSSSTTVEEAVRALSRNHVGAVMVEANGSLVGIVTDRDIAMRVVGAGLDPTQTKLAQIMTSGPASLPITASESQAIAVMRSRHVRRVPVMNEGKIAGIVTLDDLLMSGAVSPDNAGAIVEAQLMEPASAKPLGAPYPMRLPPEWRAQASEPRHVPRAQQLTLPEFKELLRDRLAMRDRERAFTAFEIVASALSRRLSPDDAKELASPFPPAVRQRLLALPPGPDPSIGAEGIEGDLAAELCLDPQTASWLLERVSDVLTDFVREPTVVDAIEHLPKGSRRTFPQPLRH